MSWTCSQALSSFTCYAAVYMADRMLSCCCTHLHFVSDSPMPFQALKHAFQQGLCDQLIEPCYHNTEPQAVGAQAPYVHVCLQSCLA